MFYAGDSTNPLMSPLIFSQVGLVLDAGIEEELLNCHLQVADATRASLGLPVVEYVVTDAPLQVEMWVDPACGQSTGRIKRPDSLLRAVSTLVNCAQVNAIAVVGRFPDEDIEEMDDYRQGKGIDLLAGVESVISHLVVKEFQIPCAHAPAISPFPLSPSLCPRSAAEELGYTFLPCVLAGLSKAPQYINTNSGSSVNSCICASDVDSVVLPVDAFGGDGALAFARNLKNKASCTILAMIVTLPLAQLFFFHVLLIKKGISTYDYIVALREQEQQLAGGQQSPQMSPASSITGLSSAISFNTFHRGAWCTPPRLFVEDQYDVVPPETGISAVGKRIVGEEPIKKKAPGTVKINPWTLARLNADEVSKVAAEARKKSKILQPVVRRETPVETDGSIGSSSRMASRPENRRRPSKRIRLLSELPMEPLPSKNVNHNKLIAETSTSLAPLQLEARSAFRASQAMSVSNSIVASSPESSLESPDLHPVSEGQIYCFY